MRNDLLEISGSKNFKGGGFYKDMLSDGIQENSIDEEERDEMIKNYISLVWEKMLPKVTLNTLRREVISYR